MDGCFFLLKLWCGFELNSVVFFWCYVRETVFQFDCRDRNINSLRGSTRTYGWWPEKRIVNTSQKKCCHSIYLHINSPAIVDVGVLKTEIWTVTSAIGIVDVVVDSQFPHVRDMPIGHDLMNISAYKKNRNRLGFVRLTFKRLIR